MDGITMRRRLTDEERLDWLRLTRADQVGPVTFFRLLDRFGSGGAALAELPRAMPAGRVPRIPGRADAERAIRAIERLGGRLIAFSEADYPQPLEAIADPPPLLSVLGDPGLLNRSRIAMVEIGRASCRERVRQYVSLSVVPDPLQTTHQTTHPSPPT